MTKRTVEIERIVTESEDVLLCDYCGLSEEDGEGEMLRYEYCHSSNGRDVTPDLHLHEDCAKHGLGDLGHMPSFKKVSPYNLLFAMDTWTAALFALAIALLLTGAWYQVEALLVAGGLAMALTLCYGLDEAKRTRDRWNGQR